MYRAMVKWADGSVSTAGTRKSKEEAWCQALKATLEGAIDVWIVTVSPGIKS